MLLSGCSLLPTFSPTPSDALYDVATSAANEICGEDNWVMENRSNQPFGASPMFSVRATCIKNPGRTFDQYPNALADALGVPAEDVTIRKFKEPPALASASVAIVDSDKPWEEARLMDLQSYPGADEGKPGEGPALQMTTIRE